MALIKCPECGKEVSEYAKACPNCGFPIGEYLEYNRGFMDIDSDKKVSYVKKKDKANIVVGDYITMGSYPQGLYGEIMPIKWKVLCIENDKALIISEYGLDGKRFNNYKLEVTWETCDLRKWLNNVFYNKAFTPAEKQDIILSNITADANPRWNNNQGKDTQDYIFVLSILEANKYFNFDGGRKCYGTAYCLRHVSDYRDDCCWWWLRSVGSDMRCTANVYPDGKISDSGDGNANIREAVRPAMWIKI